MSAAFLGQAVRLNQAVFDALIIGAGAAGCNAAVHLHGKGVSNIAMLTEDRTGGTSRNTGSDKQTYYKPACAGAAGDSPRAMAETLFQGGSMDGDLALCEAAHALQEFFHLAAIGVEFPHNKYGEFAGYQTDHDPLPRASSTGPYTSKHMTGRLEAEALRRNIRIIDRTRAVKLLTDRGGSRAFGVLCLEDRRHLTVYFAKNIIFATGGPAGLYADTVYPASQFGASGVLAREGIVFANITEWQYGIGSTAFRWNLSGSYQQVIPRYIAVDPAGGEREFLFGYFPDAAALACAVFLKGYQWPFSPERIEQGGSSLIDCAIYTERRRKGSRVYLDFTRNPQGLNPAAMDPAAREYLARSGALGDTPLERLLRLNPQAYRLYQSQGIDLARDYLEIDVLPQHHNGGAAVNIWWETSIGGVFAIGECAGTHGVKRPGGSALNAGQVGGLRAALYIAAHIGEAWPFERPWLEARTLEILGDFEKDCAGEGSESADALLRRAQNINSAAAAFLRALPEAEAAQTALAGLERELRADPRDLDALFRFQETRLLSTLLLDAIAYYIKQGGQSRGSYLILDRLDGAFGVQEPPALDSRFGGSVLLSRYEPSTRRCVHTARPVHLIPEPETWFEKVWHDYTSGNIY